MIIFKCYVGSIMGLKVIIDRLCCLSAGRERYAGLTARLAIKSEKPLERVAERGSDSDRAGVLSLLVSTSGSPFVKYVRKCPSRRVSGSEHTPAWSLSERSEYLTNGERLFSLVGRKACPSGDRQMGRCN